MPFASKNRVGPKQGDTALASLAKLASKTPSFLDSDKLEMETESSF